MTILASSALAQDFDFGGEKKKSVSIVATFKPGRDAGKGTLVLKATINKGWHIYSTSQKRGGPVATKIKLSESSQYKQAGPISYTPKPTIKKYDFWPGLDVEEHYGSVTWRVPVESTIDGPKRLKIQGVVSLQMCDANRCIPAKVEFSVSDR